MTTLHAIWVILQKDVLVELRSREVVASMGLFALLIVVIFAFSFSTGSQATQEGGPGIIWVTLFFAGNVGVGRVVEKERDNGCMAGLLMTPGGPVAVYWAKALGIFLFSVIVTALIVPVMLIFLQIEVPAEGVGTLVAALLLGALGFSLIGTLFGTMLSQTRLREVLIPLIVYPIVVPVLIAGVELTSLAMGDGVTQDADGWLKLMLLFNLIFGVASPWVFSRVMVE
ncbi:MAG: heme exporter protein B [Myxococcota bacterium]|jgi:heme exporter protein B